MLKFRVEGQKLTWENPDEVVVAGTKKYLECYFEFDGDAWSGFEYVEAFFKNGRDKPIRMLLSANRIWKEDGLCLTAGDWSVYLCATTYNAEKEEIERQITSSSVSIRVLAHGQFEDAQNSFESPEIANQYIAAMQVFEDAREKAEDERVEAENARNVFEEYSSGKTYVRGNKVSYGGSSYVLVVDEVTGVSPDDSDAWLLIASKGDTGEKGKDAVLPAGNMRKRGDFSHLPNNVIVGEVIKVTETIYKDDTVLIPCKGGFVWYTTDDDNISALGISKDTLLYEVMEALEGNILRGIVDGKAGIAIEIIKYEDNLFYVRDLVEHSISALFGCAEKLEATVPFDSIRGVLEDYKKVLFEKGTYAISNGVSWESFSGEEFEKLKIENYHLDDEIYKIETQLSDNDFGFAYNDLENVSNEDFKRKAEEAGVGGDAGLTDEKNFMVFKGVVSELPETANEGEVYKLNQDYSGGGKWTLISKGENDIDADGNVYDHQLMMYTYNSTGSVIYHGIADVIDNKSKDSVKIWIHVYHEVVGVSGDVYFNATSHEGHYSEGPGMYYASISGEKDNSSTTDSIVKWTWTHYEAYYLSEEIYPAGTYIRHNDEWIKL